MREAYRIWLLTRPTRPHEIALHVEDLPKSLCESRSYLPKGLLLPYPSGPHWRRMISDKAYLKTHEDRIGLEEEDEERAYQAMKAYRRDLDSGQTSAGLAWIGRALLYVHITCVYYPF